MFKLFITYIRDYPNRVPERYLLVFVVCFLLLCRAIL
jgi:hypothetical protein